MLYLVVHLLMNIAILRKKKKKKKKKKKIQLSIKRTCLYITLRVSSDDNC